jgi:ribosomal protein L32
MPNYDVRNDGAGPYAVFYCENCSREFRSQPDFVETATKDLGKQALGGLLRKVPLVGSAAAENVLGEDPRYSYKLNPQQLEKAWQQVQPHFRECPTCGRIVCLSDFDTQSGFCQDDSPRTSEIAESRGAQAGAAIKGFADAFGLSGALKSVESSVKQAQSSTAKCPSCGVMAAPGTKFCPECGTPMVQPAADKCPSCGAEVHGAKFCPECGAKIERAPAVTKCPSCGAETKGAKFCPECGTKVGG